MKQPFKLFLIVLITTHIQPSKCMNLKLRPPGSLTASQDSLKIVYQNEDYFIGTVNITNPGQITSLTNGLFKILKTPPTNLILKVSPIKEENGKFKTEGVTPIKHNICQWVKHDKILYSGFAKYGNLPRSCPIKPGEYFVRNYKVPVDDLPPITPPGKYKVIFDIANDNLKVLNIEWVGTIKLK